MPIYEFVCKDCKEKFEKMMSYSDLDKIKSKEVIVSCPECNSENIEKIFSKVNLMGVG